MKVVTALNRISLSLLLESELVWENSDDFSILKNTTKTTLGGSIVQLTRSITKSNGEEQDTYYFDTTLQNNVGHVILTHELILGLPHNEFPLTEIYTASELEEFIALNEESRDCFVTHWIGERSLDNAIIKYADSLIKTKKEESVKSL